jgi:hypothetical protein
MRRIPRAAASALRRIVASACVALLLAAMAPPARADDAEAVARGRAAGRGILILRDPRACGIILLRARCSADVDAFLDGRGDTDFATVPKIGAHPASGLRAFVTDGDRDGYDFALAWFNTTSATQAMWHDDPRGAALYDAGVESVLLPTASLGNVLLRWFQLGPVTDLARHLAAIPGGTLPVPTDALSVKTVASAQSTSVLRLPPGADAFADRLVAAIDAHDPPAPLVVIPAGHGDLAYAELGVAGTVLLELIDSPQWLAQSDAQLYAQSFATRLASLAPGASGDEHALAQQLRVTADYSVARAQNAVLHAEMPVVNGPQGKRIIVAAAAAQMGYNAAILRDPKAAQSYIAVLSGFDVLDAAVPGFAAARAGAASLQPSDWTAQYRLSVKLVDLIVHAADS